MQKTWRNCYCQKQNSPNPSINMQLREPDFRILPGIMTVMMKRTSSWIMETTSPMVWQLVLSGYWEFRMGLRSCTVKQGAARLSLMWRTWSKTQLFCLGVLFQQPEAMMTSISVWRVWINWQNIKHWITCLKSSNAVVWNMGRVISYDGIIDQPKHR